MFKKRMILTSFFSLCCLVLGQYSVAGLISLDDAYYGADSIILDQASGTEWLRIDLTTSLAPEIRNGTGFGQRFKLANAEELRGLMINTGILNANSCSALGSCGIQNSSKSTKAAAIREFQQYFGTTTTPFALTETTGFYDIGTGFDTDLHIDARFDDPIDNWNTYGHWFISVANSSNWTYLGDGLGCFSYNDCDSGTPPPGYWIIRTSDAPISSVPEPSLFLLLSLGLVTILPRTHKKQI